jgi:Glyoxalase-like domain
VARSLGFGARHIDIGQRPEEGHVVLADPEGDEFCVIEPDNNFLADCGFIGALACDGSQEAGTSGAKR